VAGRGSVSGPRPHASDPVAAAAVYEQVFQHGTALPALQRSRVHAELAVVYGQLGREQESVRAVSQAEDLYPDRPALDPSSAPMSEP
jgi:hypothetical protein